MYTFYIQRSSEFKSFISFMGKPFAYLAKITSRINEVDIDREKDETRLLHEMRCMHEHICVHIHVFNSYIEGVLHDSSLNNGG
jgi:hypothetical protein